MKVITIPHRDAGSPTFVPSMCLVTSIKIEYQHRHSFISVWNRGGKAGTLCVDAKDTKAFAEMLLPNHLRGVETET